MSDIRNQLLNTTGRAGLDNVDEPGRAHNNPPDLCELELLDKPGACVLFGGPDRPIHPATLARGVKSGIYPKPIRVSPNSVRWIKAECVVALQKMLAARQHEAA